VRTSSGRPRDEVLIVYLVNLASIYEDATGTKARRRYNSYRRNQGKAERLPFFAACMTAAGVAKYPSGTIRLVLKNEWYRKDGPLRKIA
jgi:hypothetical protein